MSSKILQPSDRMPVFFLGHGSPMALWTGLAHPTLEHYLPLLYASGAITAADTVDFFNVSYQASAIAMRSVVWAAA